MFTGVTHRLSSFGSLALSLLTLGNLKTGFEDLQDCGGFLFVVTSTRHELRSVVNRTLMFSRRPSGKRSKTLSAVSEMEQLKTT